MYRIPIRFHNRLMRGETPIVYAVISTLMGYRAYAERELSSVFDLLGLLADGTTDADGSHTAGSESTSVIEKSARVLSFGSFERTIQPRKDDVLTAMSSKQKQHISLQFDNADRYFSKLIPKEPFIGRTISIYVGFDADPQSEHLKQFEGTISELSVMPVLGIEADEQ